MNGKTFRKMGVAFAHCRAKASLYVSINVWRCL